MLFRSASPPATADRVVAQHNEVAEKLQPGAVVAAVLLVLELSRQSTNQLNKHMKTYNIDPNATKEERDAAIATMRRALQRALKALERTEPKKTQKILGSNTTS